MDILELLKVTYQLSDEDIHLLMPSLERLVIKKKTIVLDEGAKDGYLYLVEKGLVRSFISRDGKESTVFFAFENDIALSSPMLTFVQRAKFSLEAVEDCVLWEISRKELERLFQVSIGLANWGRELTEKFFSYSCFYLSDIYWMSKGEQYRYILVNQPEILKRVPLKDLASWLDVTPQSLSRIRASLEKLP